MSSTYSIRKPLLNEAKEKHLIKQMHPLWLQGMPGGLPDKMLKGSEISKILHFGKATIITPEGNEIKNPYSKVKENYVPFYRSKFETLHQKYPKQYPLSFPPRTKPRFAKGEPRYKVHPETLMDNLVNLHLENPRNFLKILNKKVPYFKLSTENKKIRSYLIIHYYTPLRVSEILERSINDYQITENNVTISLLRKKKKHKPTDLMEPISIPRVFPLVNELVQYLQDEDWKTIIKHNKKVTIYNLKPFNFCSESARLFVKKFHPDLYPHWFRFFYVTNLATDANVGIAELRSKTRLSLTALNEYLKTPKYVEEQLNKKMIEKYKKMGVIKNKK